MADRTTSPIDGQLDYLDFELEIGLGQGREYPVAVVRSPEGEAHDTMLFPYDELALESRLKDVQIALLRSGNTRRTAPSQEEQGVQRFGQALFDALLTGDIRSRYDMSRRAAKQQGKGLRLKLRIQTPELAALPWEFLYDAREAEYLCLMRGRPVVRYLELPQPIQPLSVTPPLRILAMIVSPNDLPGLDVEREKARIEQATARLVGDGAVELAWLEGPTWRDLQRAMRRGPWHIFHFVGHGGFDRQRDEGIIVLADEDDKAMPLLATPLGRLLADHDSLRLVLLNACEGGRGSDRDVFSSTASILVRRGIPAVLAMQYGITDRAAIEFSHAFYESLADGLPVDAAVTEARKAVSVSLPDTMEWGTPVLYLRASDGRIFDIPRGAPATRRRKTKPADESKRRLESDIPRKAGPAPEMPPSSERESVPGEALKLGTSQRLQEWYTGALSSFYTRQWSKAIELLAKIVDVQRDYKDAGNKLEAARRQLRLVELYSVAEDAVQVEAWGDAIAALEGILALDKAYRDAATRLQVARQRKELAELVAEARQLHQAGAWEAVIAIFAHIRSIDNAYPDPGDLLSSAQDALAREEREHRMAELYGQGLEHLDAGDPAQALSAFEELERIQPGYRDTALLMEEARGLLAKQAAAAAAAQEEAKRKAYQEQQEQRMAELYGQGLEHLDSGDLEQALSTFEEIEHIQPGYRDTALLVEEAQGLLAAAAAATAAAAAETAAAQEDAKQKTYIEQREERLAELYGQGLGHLRSGNPAQALNAFEEVERIEPSYRDVALWMREVRALLAKQAAATEAAATAAAQEEAKRKAYQEQQEQRLAKLYGQGLEHLNSGDLEQALSTFEKIEHVQPGYRDTALRMEQARRLLAERAAEAKAVQAKAKREARKARAKPAEAVRAVAEEPAPPPSQHSVETPAKASAPSTRRAALITAANVERVVCLRILKGHTDSVHGVAFSPDGRLLASASTDKSVRVWQVSDGAALHNLQGHTGGVRCVAFSPDGRLLVSGSGDRTVRLWRAAEATSLRTLSGHINAVEGVAFSPDSRLVASGSNDSTVCLWRVTDGAILSVLKKHSGTVAEPNHTVAFSPDGAFLAFASTGDTVVLVRSEAEYRTVVRSLKGHTNRVRGIAFSPDGNLLAAGSSDQTVCLWRVADGSLRQTLRGHSKQVNCTAFSPEGTLLASVSGGFWSSGDSTVRLWRVADGALLRTLEGHTAAVWSVVFSPDGALLATGSGDRTIRLWGISEGAA